MVPVVPVVPVVELSSDPARVPATVAAARALAPTTPADMPPIPPPTAAWAPAAAAVLLEAPPAAPEETACLVMTLTGVCAEAVVPKASARAARPNTAERLSFMGDPSME